MRISDWSSDVCSSDLLASFDLNHACSRYLRYSDLSPQTREPPNGTDRNAAMAKEELTELSAPQTAANARGAHAGSIVARDLFLPPVRFPRLDRPEEGRVGQECVSTGRSRWAPYN